MPPSTVFDRRPMVLVQGWLRFLERFGARINIVDQSHPEERQHVHHGDD